MVIITCYSLVHYLSQRWNNKCMLSFYNPFSPNATNCFLIIVALEKYHGTGTSKPHFLPHSNSKTFFSSLLVAKFLFLSPNFINVAPSIVNSYLIYLSHLPLFKPPTCCPQHPQFIRDGFYLQSGGIGGGGSSVRSGDGGIGGGGSESVGDSACRGTWVAKCQLTWSAGATSQIHISIGQPLQTPAMKSAGRKGQILAIVGTNRYCAFICIILRTIYQESYGEQKPWAE